MLVLSLLEARQRHGYEISKLIDERSGSRLELQTASLYPILYRLEQKGWVDARWVEKAGERRRRFYRLTPSGKKVLERMRETWLSFVEAIGAVIHHA